MTRASAGHRVLATADSTAYASIRKRPTSRAERYAMGKALRKEVPRKSLGDWTPRAGRPDEGELVIDLNDFDEAHPGCWEWDLRRLVASIHVAGRANGLSEKECEAAVRA